MSHPASMGDAGWLSRATLTGVAVTLSCDGAAVQRALSTVGPLRLSPDWTAASGGHPVCVELWRVGDGAVRLGTFDQHEWAKRVGALYGDLLGRLFGFSLRGGSNALASQAVATSHAIARQLANYGELVVFVPGVVIMDLPPAAHSFVLGMATDSPLARLADKVLGFGYAKEACTCDFEDRGAWTVQRESSTLRISFARSSARGRCAATELERLSSYWTLPLLGRSPRGRLMRSWLRRSPFQAGARVSAVDVLLDVEAVAIPGFESQRQAGSAIGAVEFEGVDSLVSYPRPV